MKNILTFLFISLIALPISAKADTAKGNTHYLEFTKSCTYGYIALVVDNVVFTTVAQNGAYPPWLLEGADVSGDFTGFGPRQIHVDSDNTDIMINIIYHASESSGVIAKLNQLGC